MKKYLIKFSVQCNYEVLLDGNDEDDALKKFDKIDFDDCDFVSFHEFSERIKSIDEFTENK